MYNRFITLASIVTIGAGSLFLTRPAGASAEPATYDCRQTVRAYCQWVANNYCTYGATCTYDVQSCQVLSSECW